MAEKKRFDLGDVLAGVLPQVSDPDTGREQITYVDINLIDEDQENFYSVEGIDELAENIELIGLQQPLRVRPNPGMAGRYLIVSGHRRRRAWWKLYEETPEKWREVPCIIEANAGSEALQKLRLIYANSDTRRMSSYDVSKQAEEVERLLYQLKEEGFEFPGRMRDHVAAACKVSRTKLAVLTAIRNNLVPELFAFYEKGSLNESAAYELQKLPAEAQTAIARSCQKAGSAGFIRTDRASYCAEKTKRFMRPCKCGDGDDCDHHAPRFVQALRVEYAWRRCDGDCCLSCSNLHGCKYACAKGRQRQAQDKEAEKLETASRKAKAEQEEAQRQKRYRAERQKEARRLLPLIEKAGLKGNGTMPGRYSYETVKISDIRKAAEGDFGDAHFYGSSCLPSSSGELTEWADKLGCSVDFLLGRSADPAPWTSAWISAEERSPEEGTYCLAADHYGTLWPSVFFRGRFMDWTEKSVANTSLRRIKYWMPVPNPPHGEKWKGQETLEEIMQRRPGGWR